jgi:S1-C subfamily serine protease
MLGMQIATGDLDGDRGVGVIAVTPGGPASRAGLQAGDVVVALQDTDLRGVDGGSRKLIELLGDVKPGDVVSLEYERAGAREKVELTAEPFSPGALLRRLPLGAPGVPVPLEGGFAMHGPSLHLAPFPVGLAELELVSLTPGLARYFGAQRGVLVVRAPSDAGWKLEDGDVIVEIGGRVPVNPDHAIRILRSYQPGETLQMKLMRLKKAVTLELTAPDAGSDGSSLDEPALPLFEPGLLAPAERGVLAPVGRRDAL